MKKLITTKALLIVSLAIFALGFFYDVYFAGIPFHDAPPEILEKYNFHSSVAEIIMIFGFILLVIALLSSLVKKIKQWYL